MSCVRVNFHRRYVIVIARVLGIYGSKPTRVRGRSPRTRAVYVAINPLQPRYHCYISHLIGLRSAVDLYRARATCLASFPGLQSPNAVEGLVKLLRRMTSGRRWVYIWVDVGWTSGGVALPVKCSPRLDNYCQSRRSIRDRRSTTEQSVVTFRISRSRLTDAVKTSETCGFVAIASWLYYMQRLTDVILRRSFTRPSTALGD